jgi:hypothetical protein
MQLLCNHNERENSGNWKILKVPKKEPLETKECCKKPSPKKFFPKTLTLGDFFYGDQ